MERTDGGIYLSMNAKYLRVTVHDNDFANSLLLVGDFLKQAFKHEGKYPIEQDFNVLKEAINHIWYGAYEIISKLRFGECDLCGFDYFEPDLEFVDFEDIPDWGNSESIYIPMFDGEILLR